MGNEPRELLPDPDAPPAPPAPPAAPTSTKRIVCDFCGCSLALDGTVLKGSDKVREINEQDRTIAALRRDVDNANATIATLTTERDTALTNLRTLEGEHARKRRSPFSE